MLSGPLDWLSRRLGRRYLRVILWLELQLAHVVVMGGVGLLTLFVDLSGGQFGRIVAVSQGLVLLENIVGYRHISRLLRKADPWLRGDRTPESASAAWRAIAGLPKDFVRGRALLAAVFNLVPISAYVCLELGDGYWPELPILVAGAAIVLAYGGLLRFFAFEIVVRPVLRRVAMDVPRDADLARTTLTIRARLLLTLPTMNVVGGVVVSGLSSPDRDLGSLGFGVVFAIAVAFTVSLELSLLLAGSIVGPLRSLRRGADAVAAGDLSVRVPVLGSDAAGRLTASFNQMVEGLEERERLREAFGAYVDPGVAERVLVEGTELAGEEVDVTVVFLDIRDFTAWAERASAQEVVGLLNGFYATVVPILMRHGGHANKFVGDGLLAVFGAPRRYEDHADRAVDAALSVVETVRRTYGDELRIGIGVNSGPVIAGTVGGGGRVEFTVIGDVVNTASRVEEATRVTGDDVLVTGATLAQLRRAHGAFDPRPGVPLKGKTAEVELFAPRGLDAPEAPLEAAPGAGSRS